MSTFADEQYLAPDPNNFVNQSVEYLSARQPIAATSSNTIKITPSNGGVYSNQSDFVEFRINPQHNSFIDGTKTKLNLTFTATAAATGTADFSLNSQGSVMNVFKRITVSSNGEMLEDITDANHILAMMTNLYTSKSQLCTGPTVQDLFADEATGAIGGKATGKELSYYTAGQVPAGGPTPFSCSVPIMLSSLFGPSARKSIPIGMLRNGLMVRFYFTDKVEEVYYAQIASGAGLALSAGSGYTVKNVSLEVKTIRFDDAAFEAIRNNLKTNNLEWDATTFISNLVSCNPANPSVRLLLTNTNYRDVKSIYVQSWYSARTVGQTMPYSSVFPGLYQANVLVNGDPVNSRSIGIGDVTAIKNSIPQLVMNLQSTTRASNEILHMDCQLGPQFTQAGNTATDVLLGYSYYTPTTAATNDYPVGGPNAVPNQLGPYGAGSAAEFQGIDTPSMYWGLSTLTSNDKSRELTGMDLRTKQTVLQMERYNTITGSADQVIQGVLVVGEKFHLDVVAGLLTRTL